MRTLRSEASWVDVHEIFAKHGLEYARYRAGARISDTESPDTVTPSAVDRCCACVRCRSGLDLLTVPAGSKR
ncbi:MAG: hypothetical protein ACREM6_03210, partial [Vulcanimicrobiaceae bacterium]